MHLNRGVYGVPILSQLDLNSCVNFLPALTFIVPPLLQPVAHALLQAFEEAERYTEHFPSDLLREKSAQLWTNRNSPLHSLY
jgi:hypothetical protein